jgi:hypothetical protein
MAADKYLETVRMNARMASMMGSNTFTSGSSAAIGVASAVIGVEVFA